MSVESGVFQQRLDGSDSRPISPFSSDYNGSQINQTVRPQSDISWLPSMNVGAETVAIPRTELPGAAWAKTTKAESNVAVTQVVAPEQRPNRLRLEDLPPPAWNKPRAMPEQQPVEHEHLSVKENHSEITQRAEVVPNDTSTQHTEVTQSTPVSYSTADNTIGVSRTNLHLLPDAAVLNRQSSKQQDVDGKTVQRRSPDDGRFPDFDNSADRQRAVDRIIALAQNLPEDRRRAVIASLGQQHL